MNRTDFLNFFFTASTLLLVIYTVHCIIFIYLCMVYALNHQLPGYLKVEHGVLPLVGAGSCHQTKYSATWLSVGGAQCSPPRRCRQLSPNQIISYLAICS